MSHLAYTREGAYSTKYGILKGIPYLDKAQENQVMKTKR